MTGDGPGNSAGTSRYIDDSRNMASRADYENAIQTTCRLFWIVRGADPLVLQTVFNPFPLARIPETSLIEAGTDRHFPICDPATVSEHCRTQNTVASSRNTEPSQPRERTGNFISCRDEPAKR